MTQTLVNTNRRKPKKNSKYDSYKNYVRMVFGDGSKTWVHKDNIKINKKFGGKVVPR